MRFSKCRVMIMMLLLFVLCIGVFTISKRNMAALTATLSAQPLTIIIDAGHGGEDGGAVGVMGTTESMINLLIAQKLDQLLAFFGNKTQMIRNTDISVHTDGDTISERKISDLKNRVDLVNRIEPCILISIHQNHFSQEQYSGAQTFYSALPNSKILAEEIQEQLRFALDSNNHRPVKRAESVYLLDRVRCPAVLVECGFLSNSREEQLLNDPTYQTKISCAISCALTHYISKGADELEV